MTSSECDAIIHDNITTPTEAQPVLPCISLQSCILLKIVGVKDQHIFNTFLDEAGYIWNETFILSLLAMTVGDRCCFSR